MNQIAPLKIKLFADGADLTGMLDMAANPRISGFTTNPTLMRKAGIKNYENFARDVLSSITDKPVSFEVFSDDSDEMYKQALCISEWAPNVFVKIPVTNTKGVNTSKVVKQLSSEGVKVNVTAIMTTEQLDDLALNLDSGIESFISIFAGRIADTGRNPVDHISYVINLFSIFPKAEIIWASPRELYNVIQANDIGCHVITATNDILKKITTIGKDLSEFSLETVQMFRDDAVNAGYTIEVQNK